PPADDDSIAAGRRKFSLDRIVDVDEEHVAVAREISNMPFRLVAEAAKVAEQEREAPRPRAPRQPRGRGLGARVAAVAGRLARPPERLVGDEPQQRQRGAAPETRTALVVLGIGEHEPADLIAVRD